jgi:hypothetical protein
MILIFYLFAWFGFKFSNYSALKTSLCSNHASFLSRKNLIQTQAKRTAIEGAGENIKKVKNRQRWVTDVEKLSRPDVLQISQSCSKGEIDNVRASLTTCEEALLNDIAIFEIMNPDEKIPVEFERRNERVMAGGELMGNNLEEITHETSLLQANSIDNIQTHRTIYVDTIASDHICTVAISDLQEISMKDLIKDSINYGKILSVTVEKISYRFDNSSAITALVKDKEGTLLSLSLHNFLLPSATNRDAELFLPIGTKIHIKEPFYNCKLSGFLGLRVDNPCNVNIQFEADLEGESFDPFQQDEVGRYYIYEYI